MLSEVGGAVMSVPELAGTLVQFGTAGLIGWMWLTERRSAAVMEKALLEAHERLTQDRVSIDALVGVVRENTKALAEVAESQRAIVGMLAGRRRK